MNTPNKPQKKSNDLMHILAAQKQFAPVLSSSLIGTPPFIFNFTKNNPEMATLDVTNTKAFEQYVTKKIKETGAKWGTGGYGEDRFVYRSPLFTADSEARSVHLAVDLWAPSGTPVFAPLSGVVHSFQDNNHLLDYGPTIILSHELSGIQFYTLYGHCSRSSLTGLSQEKKISAGAQIASIGSSDENGHWPSHLHFQIILDMLGKEGDFPGVARPSEKNYYLTLCPDPNLILRIPALKSIKIV